MLYDLIYESPYISKIHNEDLDCMQIELRNAEAVNVLYYKEAHIIDELFDFLKMWSIQMAFDAKYECLSVLSETTAFSVQLFWL